MTKLKLDENLSVLLVSTLSRMGYDVRTTADEDLLGRLDIDIAAAAKREGRVLLTLDLEYGDLSANTRPASTLVSFCFDQGALGLCRSIVLLKGSSRALILRIFLDASSSLTHPKCVSEDHHPAKVRVFSLNDERFLSVNIGRLALCTAGSPAVSLAGNLNP